MKSVFALLAASLFLSGVVHAGPSGRRADRGSTAERSGAARIPDAAASWEADDAVQYATLALAAADLSLDLPGERLSALRTFRANFGTLAREAQSSPGAREALDKHIHYAKQLLTEKQWTKVRDEAKRAEDAKGRRAKAAAKAIAMARELMAQGLEASVSPAGGRSNVPAAARLKPSKRAEAESLVDGLADSSEIGGGAGVAGYRRNDIIDARFGDAARQSMIARARKLKEFADKIIFGQGRATKILQDRFVQYLEGFGTRTKDPVAAHLIGLPGVGKTALVELFTQLGFKVEKIDAQKFAKTNGQFAGHGYELKMIAERNAGTPYILLVDELDKLPEIDPATGEEETIPFVGALNQILTDGYIGDGASRVNFSNAMVVTTMNFSPKEIEAFAREALKKKKKYYDFTIDDFQAFDAWLQKEPTARYKLLANLFRSNTVSRLAPNTIIMKPLSAATYSQIAQSIADNSIRKLAAGANAAKRLLVSYTAGYRRFLNRYTVVAPSGARETVAKADALTEQLINFGLKAVQDGDVEPLAQPRRLKLDYNEKMNRAEVTVTPQRLEKGKLLDGKSFVVETEFDEGARVFSQPDNVAVAPPAKNNAKERGPTRAQILKARFPQEKDLTKGLLEGIAADLVGQKEPAEILKRELNTYLNRTGHPVDNPPFLAFAGFTGIGKSELVKLAALNLGIPVVRINMQSYASDSPDAVVNFGQALENGIDDARKKAPNGKFIVLFEELDKIPEIDPSNGLPADRPIMAVVKDLMQEGVVTLPTGKSGFGPNERVIDVRDAFNVITMNLPGADFEADPRLTTIEEMLEESEDIAMSPAGIKQALAKLFRQETIDRLLSRIHIVHPLNESEYKELIRRQPANVQGLRLHDAELGKDVSELEIQLTPAYRRYLFNETVIPSEGARHTVIAAQERITEHMEEALAKIKRSSALAGKPAVMLLDYKAGKGEVVVTMTPTVGKSRKPVELLRRKLHLTFPRAALSGKLDDEERILTAAHEFGHAFIAVRLGVRINHIVAIPPNPDWGGFVTEKEWKGHTTNRLLLARVYLAIAAKAMERVMRSKDPLSNESQLDITPGPSSDIQHVTKDLWNLVYRFGVDPEGGTIERFGKERPTDQHQYAFVPPITEEETNRMGKLARRMEDYVVADLLAAHEPEWYTEKISALAKAGIMDEKEFYEMIGYPWPGDNKVFLGEDSLLAERFKHLLRAPKPEIVRAKNFKQGLTRRTAKENMDAYVREFIGLARRELHPKQTAFRRPRRK